MELDPKAKGTIVADDEEFAIDDHVVLEGFDDIKSAILTGRTDIVRRILSVAQSCKLHKSLDRACCIRKMENYVFCVHFGEAVPDNLQNLPAFVSCVKQKG